MSGDQVADGIWALLALTLVGSSLLARRLPLGTTLRMASAWVGIFGVAFVLFLFRDEGRVVWDRAVADIGGGKAVTSGTTLRIPMAEDGHFWVDASVNGRTVRFLIDSGATTTGISSEVADASGVTADSTIPMQVDTANGTIEVSTARIALLKVGPISQQDARAVIGPSFGNTNVLGMSFLSTLKRWQVEGHTLILQP